MLTPVITVLAYALALALLSAALLVGVPRLLFAIEPHVSAWLRRAERWLEDDRTSRPPEGPASGRDSLWPRFSGPA